jgi:UPF0176 protein
MYFSAGLVQIWRHLALTATVPPVTSAENAPFVVAALYQFTALADFKNLKEPLLEACLTAGVYGTLLLAQEGINGTIAGTRDGIDAALDHIRQIPGCSALEHKESFALENPFYRMKVRLKKEIVTMGVPDIDPNEIVGTYVDPHDWNALISDPDVILIDTRNEYEVSIGTFKGAIDPKTTTFREFPDWFKSQEGLHPKQKVAMFCTGGIRCEKASAFVKQQCIEDVFHLKGGILKYLETVPKDDSLWDGECFVFDQRVSVKHDLELGSYDMCRACRMPIDDDDKNSAKYVPGVSCPRCYDATDEKQKQRYQARQRQVELAAGRGETHIGHDYAAESDD